MIYALVAAVLIGPFALYVVAAVIYAAGARAECRWWQEHGQSIYAAGRNERLQIDEGEEC